jgi:large subunit ribosomal protein L35
VVVVEAKLKTRKVCVVCGRRSGERRRALFWGCCKCLRNAKRQCCDTAHHLNHKHQPNANQQNTKAAAKRYKVTGSGKVMGRHAGKQHMNEKMSTNHKRELSGSFVLAAGDAYAAAKELPYAGVR